MYSGLLYAASGILFPLPVAIAVNIAGTAVMVSIPYWLGKKLGSQAVQYILHRFAKSAMLHDLRGGSDFFFVLIVRLLGILSADVVSGYMGAVGVRYKDYLPACLLGLLSTCILFPIMGMSLSDIRSPPVPYRGQYSAGGDADLLRHLSFLSKETRRPLEAPGRKALGGGSLIRSARPKSLAGFAARSRLGAFCRKKRSFSSSKSGTAPIQWMGAVPLYFNNPSSARAFSHSGADVPAPGPWLYYSPARHPDAPWP